MARLSGSRNKLKGDDAKALTREFQRYWGQPDKLDKINASLESAITEGGVRDSLAAITLIMKYCAIPLEREYDGEVANEVVAKTKLEILGEIRRIKEGAKADAASREDGEEA